jgi:hypothetical protein
MLRSSFKKKSNKYALINASTHNFLLFKNQPTMQCCRDMDVVWLAIHNRMHGNKYDKLRLLLLY